jgi:hypothetical protein
VEKPLRAIPVLHIWVRCALVGIALVLIGVFAIALRLDPYKDGKVWREQTHTQMGLPPCTFRTVTGVPCPSCGMTTSFALLVRGDLWNSLCANAAGTLLAAICLAFIPWSLYCALQGRRVLILSFERAFTRVVIAFLVLMLLRWAIVLMLLL